MFKPLLFALITFSGVGAIAQQDDARVLMRQPTFLFEGNEQGRTLFLSDFAARVSFGGFLSNADYHTWQFGSGVDTALISFSDAAIWRVTLNLDALADSNNSIGFRMAQTHYEFFSAFEFKVDESVWYAGWRHRCRHAADSTPSRIIMKSGPEFGFNGLHHLGPIDLIWHASVLPYVFGQNEDLSHQHRLNISTSLQAEYPILDGIRLFASGGLSTMWVTRSDAKDYNLFSSIDNSHFHFSPGATLGVSIKGKIGEFKTYMSYASNLDAGFDDKAKQIHIVSLNAGFWF